MYSGWPWVKIKAGKPGEEIRIGDHRINGGGAKGSSADYRFKLRGEGPETLQPRFMLHSIGSVVKVTGINPSNIASVTIERAGADLHSTGDFSCSNPFLNDVCQGTLRTHRNYTFDIPMDLTREKAGWTQDVQTIIDSTVYMTDMSAVYRRWLIDMLDCRTPNGQTGSVTPMVWGGQEHCCDDPWWSGMVVYLPFKHYQYYGDKRLLGHAFESMKAYVDWLSTLADKNDGLLKWAGPSDWIEVGIHGGDRRSAPRLSSFPPVPGICTQKWSAARPGSLVTNRSARNTPNWHSASKISLMPDVSIPRPDSTQRLLTARPLSSCHFAWAWSPRTNVRW